MTLGFSLNLKSNKEEINSDSILLSQVFFFFKPSVFCYKKESLIKLIGPLPEKWFTICQGHS